MGIYNSRRGPRPKKTAVTAADSTSDTLSMGRSAPPTVIREALMVRGSVEGSQLSNYPSTGAMSALRQSLMLIGTNCLLSKFEQYFLDPEDLLNHLCQSCQIFKKSIN